MKRLPKGKTAQVIGLRFYQTMYTADQMRKYADKAVSDEREACLVGIQAEIDHAAINDTRLAPSFGKREGALAVRIGALEAALDAIRARGNT